MGYSSCFILSCSSEWMDSICRYVRCLWSIPTNEIDIPTSFYEMGSSVGDARLMESFHAVCRAIESQPSHICRNALAIIDMGYPVRELSALDPLKRGSLNDLHELVSMLFCAFPEIRWVLFSLRTVGTNRTKIPSLYWLDINLRDHLSALIELPCVLFDPEGLRTDIRETMANSLASLGKTTYFATREKQCAVVDDEECYAFFHGYAAYRAGYKCDLVTTLQDMRRLFLKKDKSDSGDKNISLVIEDLFLNFPDRPGVQELSNLTKRDDDYPLLQEVPSRIFVTVGHRRTGHREANMMHLDELKKRGKKVRTIFKPSSGFYNILERSRLIKEFGKAEDQRARASIQVTGEKTDSHSSPGRLLMIAEVLNERAEKILREATSVEDCIRGAVLALESKEMLGYRTPTTCLEAVALRHQLEVKGECMFYGVGYNIDLQYRLREIETEVDEAARWFHPDVRQASALNSKMAIINEIMKILRDYGQFDEEQTCLRHFRKLHRQWYSLNHPWQKGLLPIRWYIETLVGSLPIFVAAILAWPLALGIVSWILQAGFDKVSTLADHITHAFVSFFALQPTGFTNGAAAHGLAIVIIFAGFLHLGIFISYLYTFIVRR